MGSEQHAARQKSVGLAEVDVWPGDREGRPSAADRALPPLLGLAASPEAVARGRPGKLTRLILGGCDAIPKSFSDCLP